MKIIKLSRYYISRKYYSKNQNRNYGHMTNKNEYTYAYQINKVGQVKKIKIKLKS